jgi:transposase
MEAHMGKWYKVELSEDEQVIVHEERNAHPNLNIRNRMLIIWLLHQGLQRQQAADIAQVQRITVQRLVKAFQKGRLDALRKWDAEGSESELASFRDIIRKSLEERPVCTIAEAAEHITELTGLVRGQTQVRMFLKDLGFKWKRTRAVPLPPKKTWQSTSRSSPISSIMN